MKGILVTRPAGRARALIERLTARGHRVFAVPTVVTRRLGVKWPHLDTFDWIVVTSAAGVEATPQVRTRARWAAVGEATAAALRARGIQPGFVPDQSNGLSLGETLPDPYGARVLLVRGSLADGHLAEALRARGAVVDEVTCYETVEGPESSAAPLRDALADGLALVVFASGSAVRGYVTLHGSVDVPAVTIGPRTTAVARASGFEVVAEATRQEVGELVKAVERGLRVEVRGDA